MLNGTGDLLRNAGRSWEILIGWVCAFISTTFAGILVWVAYLVAWRNPREYGVNDLYKPTTLIIFSVLLAIAVGFSLFAFRLIIGKRKYPGLMSPMVLRIWGAFFGLMSIAVLIDAIVKKRWAEAHYYWGILTTGISMGFAAFVLARRLERSKAREKPISQPDHPENGTQPIRSD